ncbi:DUF4249 domain-containing protein [Larkinella rosea]|uniref:DUF4249 domain-containing protein n=1 Tax=Larkinella rosea TaxID=2025312 RepID=A0A3P1BAQ8_9BACT|nr:DUF4249 domain-containing protein [Larkinella rosea]RRA98138.1 DUF4249 domain-containing protein [Larkinella rosea]
MRFYSRFLKLIGVVSFLIGGCVDAIELPFKDTTNLLVIEGTITNLPETQRIRLSRAKADPITGRLGTIKISKAIVEVLVDSSLAVPFTEKDSGTYQAPLSFKGQVGHAYQLRFTLPDGRNYTSTTEVMQPSPPIGQLTPQFNANSLPLNQRINGVYAAAYDFFLTTQDPTDQHNYYRWSWKLWERQEWCRTCDNAYYSEYYPFDQNRRFEDCVDVSRYIQSEYFTYDYSCRTPCWQVFEGYDINVFDDQYSNGGTIVNRRIAQVPYYQAGGCLVDIRQGALTAGAYRYYKLLQDQTQNTGGLADTPPTVLSGNVHNLANRKEVVIGYFTAEGVSSLRYWLDRRDAQTAAPGLYQALSNGKNPHPETNAPEDRGYGIFDGSDRPPTAVCLESDSRTALKPTDWRD